jgi:hypothetical protein
VVGVKSVPIAFGESDGGRTVQVGDALTMRVEQVVGMDGAGPAVISNPLLGAVTQPVTQAKSLEVTYRDAWEFSTSDRNSFITDFSYAG